MLTLAVLLPGCAQPGATGATPAAAPMPAAAAPAPQRTSAASSPAPVTAAPATAPARPLHAPSMSDPLPPERAEKANPAAPSRACRTDADCAIKDVGNCCGSAPACVNVKAPVDPAAVKAQCAKQGRASICGFKPIESCSCVAGQCEGNLMMTN
ncbi:hypothetical protein [Lysobacter xanthus]